MSTWLTQLNITLDKLENAARTKTGSTSAIAEATHLLSMLESQIASFSPAQKHDLETHLSQILTRISTVINTVETERNATGAELSALRTRANALKSYANK